MCRYCTSRRASRGTGFFFFLIAVSALLRAVWLGVPNQFFSEGYAPKPIVIGQARWREMIIGEGLERYEHRLGDKRCHFGARVRPESIEIEDVTTSTLLLV